MLSEINPIPGLRVVRITTFLRAGAKVQARRRGNCFVSFCFASAACLAAMSELLRLLRTQEGALMILGSPDCFGMLWQRGFERSQLVRLVLLSCSASSDSL